MLSINEIDNKYKITEEQKLENKIYEARKNGQFYIKIHENEIKRVAREKFKEEDKSVIVSMYLDTLKKAGYKTEIVEKRKAMMLMTEYEYYIYISWKDITIKEFEYLKEIMSKNEKKITQLENKITYLLNRNLLQRILNKDKGEH